MKQVFTLPCSNELGKALFPSMEASSASHPDSLHCTGKCALWGEIRQGEEGATSVVGHILVQEAPRTTAPPPPRAWITRHWMFLLPLLSCSLPAVQTLSWLGSVYKAGSPRNTHLLHYIKWSPLWSRNQTGSYFWPLKCSGSVWTQNSFPTPHFKSTLVWESKWSPDECSKNYFF